MIGSETEKISRMIWSWIQRTFLNFKFRLFLSVFFQLTLCNSCVFCMIFEVEGFSGLCEVHRSDYDDWGPKTVQIIICAILAIFKDSQDLQTGGFRRTLVIFLKLVVQGVNIIFLFLRQHFRPFFIQQF